MTADPLNPMLVEWALARDGGPTSGGDLLSTVDPQVAEKLADRIRAFRRFRRFLAVDEPTAPPCPPPAGPVNGRYDRLDLVGEGGYADVYRATDTVLGRPVALKFLRGEVGGRAGFLREARILAGLRHPHIVTIHDADTDAATGRAYLALAWVDGGSLGSQIGRFVGHPDRAAKLVEQVALAVQHAHVAGVCHRDLKPGNILLGADDTAFVADFGIAKLLSAAAGEPAAPGPTARHSSDDLGTPPYMAPEQFRPDGGAVGPAADVWAVGVILYELLTGRRPFPGRSRAECEAAVFAGPPVRPREIARGVSRELDFVCTKCLTRKPEDRWASAGDLATALIAVRSGGRVPGLRPTFTDRVRRVRRPLQVAGLSVLLTAATVGGVWATGRDRGSEKIEAQLTARDLGSEKIEERLRAGEEVTLIPDIGPPAFFKPVTEYGVHTRKDRPSDVPFGVIFDQWRGMLELVENNPCPAFRLDAEIYFASATTPSEAGVYVGRRLIDGQHHYLSLSVQRNPGCVRVTLTAHRLNPSTPGHPDDRRRDLAEFELPAGSLAKDYIPLTLDITPARVCATVAGRTLRRDLPPNGRLVTAVGHVYHLTPLGGVGLTGTDAVVTVQNVTLRASPPER